MEQSRTTVCLSTRTESGAPPRTTCVSGKQATFVAVFNFYSATYGGFPQGECTRGGCRGKREAEMDDGDGLRFRQRGPLRHTKVVRVSLPAMVTHSCPHLASQREKKKGGASLSLFQRKKVSPKRWVGILKRCIHERGRSIFCIL